MDDPLEIVRRKERLIVRCAVQRDEIARSLHELRGPVAVGDRALAVGRTLRAHPLLVAAAVAAIVVLRRRRNLLALVARGYTLWRAWTAAAGWAAGLGLGRFRGRDAGKS